MIKTELMKVLEHMPDDCEISIEFFDSACEEFIMLPVGGVAISSYDNLDKWNLALCAREEAR